MKKILLAATLLLSSISMMAQKVQVIDKTNLQPLPQANIYSNKPDFGIITDNNGEADISALKGADSIYIRYIGYQDAVYSYKKLESIKFKVFLTEKIYSLGDVVVSASKFEEKKEDVPRQMQVMKAKELQLLNQQSSADVLMESGNVLVQKSQLGGGSPIIRGFEANKVLLVVDGVRMNNAIYRVGHLQNVLTLDNTIMDKIEIVFGPGSVVYGSDALGGVMHFYTRNPFLATEGKKTDIGGNAFLRYSTADQGKTGHLDFNIGLKKIGFLTSITYSNFSDLRQGDQRNPFYGDWGKRLWYAERIEGRDSMIVNKDPNIQKFSGYRQFDILEKILFRQNTHVSHILNFQYSTSSDIPRYDRLTEMKGDNPKYAEWYYGPQKRLFGSYSLNLKNDHGTYDDARFILAYQHIEESRHDRKFNDNSLNHRTEKLDIITLNADLAKKIKRNEIRYGFEGTFNNVNSTANKENIATGEKVPLDTRYPDGGSIMMTLAAYATHSLEISPKWILNDGLRLSYVGLHSEFVDTTFYPFPFSEVRQNNTALNGNLGLVYMPGYEWRFAILGSTGFRAPNVDDVSKVFESIPGSVVVPNPDLKPEYTWNGELSISKGFNERIRLEATGFYTYYINAIVKMPSTFNGEDSIYYDGQLSRVMSSQNAQEAYICGIYGGLQADVTDNFSITSTINYTYARIKTDTTDYPLDHIPPIFGKTSFNLKLNRFNGELSVLYNGWKKVEDYNMYGEDNFSNATEYGMPAWYCINLRAAYQFNKYIQLQVALENLLDKNYRVFASNISSPGRNLVVTLRGSF